MRKIYSFIFIFSFINIYCSAAFAYFEKNCPVPAGKYKVRNLTSEQADDKFRKYALNFCQDNNFEGYVNYQLKKANQQQKLSPVMMESVKCWGYKQTSATSNLQNLPTNTTVTVEQKK